MSADWLCRCARGWHRDRSGTAGLEFALLAPLWFALLDIAIDFAEAFYLKMKIATAVNIAAQYALLNAQAVTATTVVSFLANVQSVAQTAAGVGTTPVVSVLFNNAASAANASNYYCVAGSLPTVFTSTGTSSASCGGSVMSGKFVTINITGSKATFIVTDPILGSTITINDTAVVRFE